MAQFPRIYRSVKAITVLLLALATLLAGCAFGGGSTTQAAPKPLNAVPAVRLANLARGVNLDQWFAEGDLNATTFQQEYSASDLRLLKQLGFTYVRLPLDPTVLLNEAQPGALDPTYTPYFDTAISRILAAKLAVIVDVHPPDSVKQQMATDESFVTTLVQFVAALAQHLSVRDPDRVFLEVVNEPQLADTARWANMQARMIQAIRSVAPVMTLITEATPYASIDSLRQTTPVADANVVYTFHFYDPIIFTHQGASWVLNPPMYFAHGIPYPATTPACDASERNLEAALLPSVQAYCQQQWNAQAISARIDLIARWAVTNHVHLICDEFGVDRDGAPAVARAAWISDVRRALEHNGIGWGLWEFGDTFGFVSGTPGQRIVDVSITQALGLS